MDPIRSDSQQPAEILYYGRKEIRNAGRRDRDRESGFGMAHGWQAVGVGGRVIEMTLGPNYVIFEKWPNIQAEREREMIRFNGA